MQQNHNNLKKCGSFGYVVGQTDTNGN